jgi:hypothetical protein
MDDPPAKTKTMYGQRLIQRGAVAIAAPILASHISRNAKRFPNVVVRIASTCERQKRWQGPLGQCYSRPGRRLRAVKTLWTLFLKAEVLILPVE